MWHKQWKDEKGADYLTKEKEREVEKRTQGLLDRVVRGKKGHKKKGR